MTTAIQDEGQFLDQQAALARGALAGIGRRVTGSLTDGGAVRGVVGGHPLPSLGVSLAAGVAAGMQIAAMCDRRNAEAATIDLQRAAGVAPAGLEADGVPRDERNLMTEFLRIARALGLG
ncbi:MAG TPA: hypothetical protein VEL07_15395 [Planctomycetota bacterium]|nr:hypothetical protein [Planctomycetota bacterium]